MSRFRNRLILRARLDLQRFPSVLFLALILILGSAPERAIHAAGFELLMMNGESVATDATAVVFNPAGLGFLERPQVIVTPTVVTVDFEFESTVGTTLTGNDGGDAGDDFNFTGGAFAGLKVTEDLGIRKSMTQPFGITSTTTYPGPKT